MSVMERLADVQTARNSTTLKDMTISGCFCCMDSNECEGCLGKAPDFVREGDFLANRKDDKYYKTKFPTLKAFTASMGVSRGHARRLIRAMEVYMALKGVAKIMPTTESQVRPLTGLKTSQVVEAWARAVELARGNQPSSRLVTYAAVHTSLHGDIPPSEKDVHPSAPALGQSIFKNLPLKWIRSLSMKRSS